MGKASHQQPGLSLPEGKVPALRVVPMPADSNQNGDIFGGWIMAQVDVAGGIIAGHYFGQLAGASNLVTLDMGGTSCDVGLVRDGKISHSNNFEIEWGVNELEEFIPKMFFPNLRP